jgi:hypothetical protein
MTQKSLNLVKEWGKYWKVFTDGRFTLVRTESESGLISKQKLNFIFPELDPKSDSQFYLHVKVEPKLKYLLLEKKSDYNQS